MKNRRVTFFVASALSLVPACVGTGTLGGGTIGTLNRSNGDVRYASSEGGLGKEQEGAIEVTPVTPVILGSLDPESIRRIVRSHTGEVRYCYEFELTRTPGLYGQIVMTWVINGEGEVIQATVAETQMKNATVENCLASRIKKWVFPKPKDGDNVIVHYPFVFKQTADGSGHVVVAGDGVVGGLEPAWCRTLTGCDLPSVEQNSTVALGHERIPGSRGFLPCPSGQLMMEHPASGASR